MRDRNVKEITNPSVDLTALDLILFSVLNISSDMKMCHGDYTHRLSNAIGSRKFLTKNSHFSTNLQEWFIGRELFDKEPTIVHHFAFHHDPSAFKYPLGETGILLSWPAVKQYGYFRVSDSSAPNPVFAKDHSTLVYCVYRVHSRIARQQLPRDFSIDAQHELAVYLMEGVNMTRSSALCLRPGPSCATWIQPFEPCVRSS